MPYVKTSMSQTCVNTFDAKVLKCRLLLPISDSLEVKNISIKVGNREIPAHVQANDDNNEGEASKIMTLKRSSEHPGVFDMNVGDLSSGEKIVFDVEFEGVM